MKKKRKRKEIMSPFPSATTQEGMDRIMQGTVIDGKLYLGNGAWLSISDQMEEIRERHRK